MNHKSNMGIIGWLVLLGVIALFVIAIKAPDDDMVVQKKFRKRIKEEIPVEEINSTVVIKPQGKKLRLKKEGEISERDGQISNSCSC